MGIDNVNGWICSDPDCPQYYKQIDDYSWSFSETRMSNKGWTFCNAVIDIRDYDIDELLNYCIFYYDSLEAIVRDYGFKDGLRIMAECVFEQLSIDETDYEVVGNDFEAAAEYTRKWVSSHHI